MDDGLKKIAGAFLIGGAIGALVALLYAPQTGKQTRKDISRTARRVKREAVDLVDDTVDYIHDFTGDIKDKVSDIIDSGKELSDGAKKEILKNLDHGLKVIEKQKKRIADTLGL